MKPIAKLTVAEIAAPLTETEQNIMIAELCSDLGFTNPAIESYATVSGGLAFPAEFVMSVGEGDHNLLYGVTPGIESEYYPESFDINKWRFTIYLQNAPTECDSLMFAFPHYDLDAMKHMAELALQVVSGDLSFEEFDAATEDYQK